MSDVARNGPEGVAAMGSRAQKIWREIKPHKAQGATRCNQTKPRLSMPFSSPQFGCSLTQTQYWQGSSKKHLPLQKNARLKKPQSIRRQVQPKRKPGCTTAVIHAL